MNTTCDVAIVGGGPAGLGAALELSKLGLRRVVVLERFGEAGGIPRHCGYPPFGMREFKRVLSGPAYARRLVQAAEDAGVEIRTDTTVTAIRPGGVLELATTAGAQTLTARRVLIATGNRERTRAQLLAPGVRPVGVMNTGALQSMVYLEGKRPFSRPVIVGSEIVALSALLTCRRHGIKPVAMVETRDRPQTRRIDMMLARLMGVPVLAGAELLAIEGRPRVEALRVRLRDEIIDGAAYTYSHGLRHHSGNCQRIAHGHRSPLIIERNGVRDTALEAEWAEKLNDRYLAEEGDLIDRPGRELVFSYEAPQGRFRIRLPRKQVWLLPTPTTIEWIADWLARQIALDSGDSIRVEAYEGINKGAIARHPPQTAREPLVLPEHEDTSATS